MVQTDREWFDCVVKEIAEGNPTIFSQTLVSALHTFDKNIKYFSDKSVILQSLNGNRAWVQYSVIENTNQDCLTVLSILSSDPETLFNDDFTDFDNVIVYLQEILK